MKIDKLEKQDEFKAFNGFVNKCLYDFHESHPNESISRKTIEEECFGRWSDLDDSTKISFFNLANEHFDAVKSVDQLVPSKKTKRTPKKREELSSNASENAKRLSEGEEKPPIKRKKKDPNQPKHPSSAFNFFMREMFKHVDDHPELQGQPKSTTTISKIWNEASTEVREKFQELSRRDKERYHREMEEYKTTGRYTPLNATSITQYGIEKDRQTTTNGLDLAGPSTSRTATLETGSNDENLFDSADDEVEIKPDYTTLTRPMIKSTQALNNTAK